MSTTLDHYASEIPQVKKHTHLLTFLSEYFSYRKKQDSSFTYELWSKELGFKSTAIMYLICKGKRSLTINSTNKIANYLKLSLNEKKHFLLLAHCHQAKSVEIKSALFDKILESTEFKEHHLQSQNYKNFIMSTSMPLVRMVLAYDDIKGTENEVLDILDISREQLKKDLVELEKMNLISKIQLEGSNETIWKSNSQALRFNEETGPDIMELFHIKTLAETTSVVTQRDAFKKLRSLILAINPDDHQILEDEVDQFIVKLKNKFAYKMLDGKQLIKFNCQAYQVSKTKKPR